MFATICLRFDIVAMLKIDKMWFFYDKISSVGGKCVNETTTGLKRKL